MGSPNDRDKMAPAVKTLEEFGLEPDERVLSAHRTPEAVVEMARGARDNGYVAFICGAGMAAQLASARPPRSGRTGCRTAPCWAPGRTPGSRGRTADGSCDTCRLPLRRGACRTGPTSTCRGLLRGGQPCGPSRGRSSARVGRALIGRYALSPMSDLFTDQARLGLWLEVEILAVEAWASLGVVPEEDAKAVRERAPAITSEFVTATQEREKVTEHDLAAFVDVVQQAIGGPAAAWVPYGLTSSDVVDTARGATLARAAG